MLSFFDLMGGLLLRFFLEFPLVTEIVAEEEEEDRETDLSLVGMMRTMTAEKALARPAAYSSGWTAGAQAIDRSTAGLLRWWP